MGHPVHGMSRTRLFTAWQNMRKRCYSKSYQHRDLYKGIKVCPEWQYIPDAFFEWSLANGYADNLTLDRIDPSKDYSPENCRWITPSQQQHNTRKSSKATTSKYKGVTLRKRATMKDGWQASIWANGKSVNLGIYETEKEAAKAYDKAALEHFGEFARINFPAKEVAQ